MSADSTRKQSKHGFNGQVVLPQPITDPSIIESVAGFIHEVVPQAYSSVLPGESRDSILWARFETFDYNDPENYPLVAECESDTTPPLLLVLGYGTGVQVWSIPGSGDATEVLSWTHGTVRTLRFLNAPRGDSDPFSSKRPIVAIVDSAGPGPQYCTVNFISLKTAEVIKSIKFKTPIVDILCNKKSIVITFLEKIAIFDVATLEDRLTITTCYPSPGVCSNPVALGQRWLAYAEKTLTTWHRSSGGCEGDGAQSYTATAIHAVKTLGKGLRDLSGSLTGNAPPPVNNNSATPGIVSIIDIETKMSKEDDSDNIIAHFVAHIGPIVALSFDASGMLLVTADKHGHRFHVFRIHPHPVASQLAAVHHLYVLHRGETTARVQDITVSRDSRWVAVSSVRGTTHVFPITPYGGPVTVRTHTTPNVVNRLSRFERSAGLSDGRGSPLPEAPIQPLTPRLPPYPHPTTLNPLAQLRRTPIGEESPLAAVFAGPRAWLPGRPRVRRSVIESLFIISSAGTLIQYDLDPRCIPGVPKDKISYDTGIELGVEANAEWSLLKPPYSSNMQPPLDYNNPIILHGKLPQNAKTSSSHEDRWLSQVEIITHTGPHRRLWMGPQFSFKSIDPAPCDDSQNECMNPIRSNPVNMPRRPYMLIEGGSGGSIDSPQMTGYGSGNEDTIQGESRLREDLADAMLETSTTTHASGVLGGGRMRTAILERQVNPLGTVITLPSDSEPMDAVPVPRLVDASLQVDESPQRTLVDASSQITSLIDDPDVIPVKSKSKSKKKSGSKVSISVAVEEEPEVEPEVSLPEVPVEPEPQIPDPPEPEPEIQLIDLSPFAALNVSEMLDSRRQSRLDGDSQPEPPSNPESSQSDAPDVLDQKKGKKTRKLKSPDSGHKSPSPSKSDPKPDTDSSDEALNKSQESVKQMKRKKVGKKTEEVPEPEPKPKLKTKSQSDGTLDVEKSDYETCSEKKSDSSIESFPDLKKKPSDPNGNFQEAPKSTWSSVVKRIEKERPSPNAEDRDSVYESCNDDEYPSLVKPEPTPDLKTESSSSNAEEKTDSGEKGGGSGSTTNDSSKKLRKQKKKRR